MNPKRRWRRARPTRAARPQPATRISRDGRGDVETFRNDPLVQLLASALHVRYRQLHVPPTRHTSGELIALVKAHHQHDLAATHPTARAGGTPTLLGKIPVGQPIPDWVWREPDMVQALAARDIAAVFRLLQSHGLSQRAIATRTGQSQSEISEILGGRKVVAYDLLARLADGLTIPRGFLGLAYIGPLDAGTDIAADPVAGMAGHADTAFPPTTNPACMHEAPLLADRPGREEQ